MPSRICSVPLDWTMDVYARHNCADGSHAHISRSQLATHEREDLVYWLRPEGGRREPGIVQIELLEKRDDRWAGKPSISRASGATMNGGLSHRVGAYLAKRVRQRHPWALVMLSHINMRPEREAPAA